MMGCDLRVLIAVLTLVVWQACGNLNLLISAIAVLTRRCIVLLCVL